MLTSFLFNYITKREEDKEQHSRQYSEYRQFSGSNLTKRQRLQFGNQSQGNEFRNKPKSISSLSKRLTVDDLVAGDRFAMTPEKHDRRGPLTEPR